MTPGELARAFHETYERLAPDFGYETRRDSAVPWDDVPERNKALMTAVCDHLLETVIVGKPAVAPPDGRHELAEFEPATGHLHTCPAYSDCDCGYQLYALADQARDEVQALAKMMDRG